MNTFSKHFAIIDKIKSMVGVNEHRHKSDSNSSVSSKIANKIQVSSYNLSQKKISKDLYTPPYMIIAEQLGVLDSQIFCAAVYSLARIAINEKKHSHDILAILDKSLSENKDDGEKNAYLSKKILEIKSGKEVSLK